MKTISLEIEDNLYTALVALIQQLPVDKVQIVNDSQRPTHKVKVCDVMQFSDTINWPVDGLEYQRQVRSEYE